MGREGMVDGERVGNGGGAAGCGGGVVGWSGGDAVNGFAVGVENGAVADLNRAGSSCQGFRTYKRRRYNKMSNSEIKLLEVGKIAADSAGQLHSAGQLPEKTVEERMDRVLPNNSCDRVSRLGIESHAVMSGLGDVPMNRGRNIALEHWYQSLCGNEGGLRGCIQDALMFHPESNFRTAAKGPLHSCEANDKCPPHADRMVNGIHNSAKGHVGAMPDESLSESNRTKSDLCRRAFFDIVMSDKFAQLSCLLLENFHGIKIDNILDISLINLRMKEGAYERSPMLFHSDIQQLWTKLQKIGAEMVALAKSLSDKSKTSYREQFLIGESDLHTKSEQTEPYGGVYKVCACRRCGEKADGRDCLVCDSCEEMYHVSCIEPAVEEIPSKSWYCADCTANGIESPHENCAVCDKLNASQPPNNGFLAIEETFMELEENSNDLENGFQFFKDGENFHRCNLCGSEAKNGEDLTVCGHPFCPHKYYHVSCLTSKQLTKYGACWYCPSCLCRGCLTDQDDEKIVLCDGCDHAYHIYCMQPPRISIPRGKWFCRKCDAGIQRIRKTKRAYENIENKLNKKGKDGKVAFEDLVNAQKEKVEKESGDKSGGVDMLLTAAKTLNYEEKMAAIETKS
ncbi:hypothetical protein U1Q18_037218 [Sarracenia purpurea var. burkii]